MDATSAVPLNFATSVLPASNFTKAGATRTVLATLLQPILITTNNIRAKSANPANIPTAKNAYIVISLAKGVPTATTFTAFPTPPSPKITPVLSSNVLLPALTEHLPGTMADWSASTAKQIVSVAVPTATALIAGQAIT